jgi:NitT/TauT family transport system ATP-binding protein
MALVAFRDVMKVFRSRQGQHSVALRGFNLEIDEGEFFCLLGPTGCGKTTALNLLAGFERPTAGTIELTGQPIVGPNRDRAVVFQGDDSLYPWLTAIENVEFGLRIRGLPRRERRERARRYLELVGLTGQERKHPHELSGGMRQRIQIARVLANEPKMLLMDEPFGALDAQTRAVMQEELVRIWRATESAVLFITHDIDEAITLGSRIGLMTAGPGAKIKGIVEIKLDGQRDRTDDAFLGYYKVVHQMIRDEVNKTLRRGE